MSSTAMVAAKCPSTVTLRTAPALRFTFRDHMPVPTPQHLAAWLEVEFVGLESAALAEHGLFIGQAVFKVRDIQRGAMGDASLVHRHRQGPRLLAVMMPSCRADQKLCCPSYCEVGGSRGLQRKREAHAVVVDVRDRLRPLKGQRLDRPEFESRFPPWRCRAGSRATRLRAS